MSTDNGYVDFFNDAIEKIETKKIGFNVLNDILNRMGVNQITFSVITFGNKDMIMLEFVEDIFRRRHEYMRKRKFYWKDIDSMFLNIVYVVKYVKENSSIYCMLDCNTMKFLEIISECHSLEEFMLKVQLMGY